MKNTIEHDRREPFMIDTIDGLQVGFRLYKKGGFLGAERFAGYAYASQSVLSDILRKTKAGWVVSVDHNCEPHGESHYMDSSTQRTSCRAACGADMRNYNWTLHSLPKTKPCEKCRRAFLEAVNENIKEG